VVVAGLTGTVGLTESGFPVVGVTVGMAAAPDSLEVIVAVRSPQAENVTSASKLRLKPKYIFINNKRRMA
jgi:hypothetical protein